MSDSGLTYAPVAALKKTMPIIVPVLSVCMNMLTAVPVVFRLMRGIPTNANFSLRQNQADAGVLGGCRIAEFPLPTETGVVSKTAALTEVSYRPPIPNLGALPET